MWKGEGGREKLLGKTISFSGAAKGHLIDALQNNNEGGRSEGSLSVSCLDTHVTHVTFQSPSFSVTIYWPKCTDTQLSDNVPLTWYVANSPIWLPIGTIWGTLGKLHNPCPVAGSKWTRSWRRKASTGDGRWAKAVNVRPSCQLECFSKAFL